MNKCNKKIRSGFTLAEVLITLGIIGIVAALTMPALIQKNNEKETVTKLKKVYSVLSQAYLMSKNDYGSPEGWDWGSNADADNNFNVMKKYFVSYLNVMKVCAPGGDCIPDVMYKRLNGINHTNYYSDGVFPSMILNDGTMIFFVNGVKPDGTIESTSKALCYLYVDINNKKLPNQFGVDLFLFAYTSYGIFPVGIVGEVEKYGKRNFENSCNKSQNIYMNGVGCTAWVIFNENMDYLHCNDLVWNGKTKCSK